MKRLNISQLKLVREEYEIPGNFTSIRGEYYISSIGKTGFLKFNGCMVDAQNDEDIRELLAAKIMEQIGFPHADIILTIDKEGENGCLSVNILNENEKFIDISKIEQYRPINNIEDFISNDLDQISLIPGITSEDLRLRKEYLIKYMLVSALISNTDIKMDNMFIIQDTSTGKYRNAEYYDMGVSFIECNDRKFFGKFSSTQIIEQLYNLYPNQIAPFGKNIQEKLNEKYIESLSNEDFLNEFSIENRELIIQQLKDRINYISKLNSREQNKFIQQDEVTDNKEEDNDNISKNSTSKINDLSIQIYDKIKNSGIEKIKSLFSSGTTLQEQIKFDANEEYIKRMILAQMDIGKMLLTHKFSDLGWDSIPEFNKKSEEIRRKLLTNENLKFDEETLNLLFGNRLDITLQDEYEEWKEFIDNGHKEKNFDTIYFEEEFKVKYENETNPIKKFFHFFKYRNMNKNTTLEDPYVKKVREMLKNEILKNSDNTFEAHRIVHSNLERGVIEYENIKEIEDITRMVLISLSTKQDKPISIEETCRMIREEMKSELGLTRNNAEYRQRQVTLGSESGISNKPVIQTIPFEEIPDVMQDFQREYQEAYNKEQSKEGYIRQITKIYADFIYVQPYEDGNKRTATCLFNSMLFSKGITPPPISLSNDEQIVEAIYNAKDKDYTMLQDVIIDRYRALNDFNGNSDKKEQNIDKGFQK